MVEIFNKLTDYTLALRDGLESTSEASERPLITARLAEGNESNSILNKLVKLGCSFEGANSSLISLNIPPEADLEVVRQSLIHHDLQWEHADPSYSEINPGDS